MDNKVIMPVLGMNQDTGMIAEWCKKLGDFVNKGDVLFTVETDKASQEIESLHEGYLSQIYFLEGEDVPVGKVIALLTEAKQEEQTAISKSSSADKSKEETTITHITETNITSQDQIYPSTIKLKDDLNNFSSNKILASPKAKRIAFEKGINLKELVDEGIPQPLHAQDIIDYQPSIGSNNSRASISAKVDSEIFLKVFEELKNEDEELEFITIIVSYISGAARFTNLYNENISVINELDQNSYLNPDLGSLKFSQNNKISFNSSVSGADIYVWNFLNKDIDSLNIDSNHAMNITISNKNKWKIYVDFDSQKLNPVKVIAFVEELIKRIKQPLRQLL